jgi:hypothetical protein
MSEFQILLDLLQGGSDAALVAIAFAIWRVERRVYRLELLLFPDVHPKKKGK